MVLGGLPEAPPVVPPVAMHLLAAVAEGIRTAAVCSVGGRPACTLGAVPGVAAEVLREAPLAGLPVEVTAWLFRMAAAEDLTAASEDLTAASVDLMAAVEVPLAATWDP